MGLAFDKTLRMIDPKMAKGRHIQRVVTGQGNAVDNAVRHNHLFHNRQEGFALGIGDDLGVHAAASLKDAKDRDFARSPAPAFAFAASAKITFINFDRPAKRGHIRQILSNDLAQAMVKEPGGVAMNTDSFGGHPGGRAGHEVFEEPIDLRRPEFAILYVHSAA